MRIILFSILIILSGTLPAQLDNRMFEQRSEIIEADTGLIRFNFEGLMFNKNNEYFGLIADGYTLFGYQVNPSFSYQPYPNIRFDVGLYLQKDYGNNAYSTYQPTFTISHRGEHGRLLIGTLEGATSHRIIEPLMDFERVLVNRLENGLQYIINNDRLFFDAWFDWQKMLYRGEDDQEELAGGISMDYRLTTGTWKFYVPFQFMASHVGGQIDTSPRVLQTYTNAAIGLGVESPTSDAFVRSVRFDGYYTTFKDFGNEPIRPYVDGDGIYLNTTLRMKKGLEMMVSYWQGNEFLSIMGGQLYQSESSTVKNPFYVEQNRELLILRLFHNVTLADRFILTSRFEPLYDLANNRFMFSHSLHLNYRLGYNLVRISKSDRL